MPSEAEPELAERLGALAQDLIRREARHQDGVERARIVAAALHQRVSAAISHFNSAVAESAPHLEVCVTDPRSDDKHLHAAQFDLERGRYRAIVTVKSKGEVTLVGPFKQGKAEGPCPELRVQRGPGRSRFG